MLNGGKPAVALKIYKDLNGEMRTSGRCHHHIYLQPNIVIDQPDEIFAFDNIYKDESSEVVQSREMYFAIYQGIARGPTRQVCSRTTRPDFFDLIIVDECHRGSARDDSSWRVILEYFEPAYQLGMTATPLRDKDADLIPYFGNPIYQYSLRQGIRRRVSRTLPCPPDHYQWDAARVGVRARTILIVMDARFPMTDRRPKDSA